ncbi:MAG: hypothetical protein AB1555_02345 [Nitrospirota bacterium]
MEAIGLDRHDVRIKPVERFVEGLCSKNPLQRSMCVGCWIRRTGNHRDQQDEGDKSTAAYDHKTTLTHNAPLPLIDRHTLTSAA